MSTFEPIRPEPPKRGTRSRVAGVSADPLVLRGYGPLLVRVLVVALLVALLPSRPPDATEVLSNAAESSPSPGDAMTGESGQAEPGVATAPGAQSGAIGRTGGSGGTGGPTGTTGGGATGGGSQGAVPASTGSGPGGGTAVTGTGCEGGAKQVSLIAYSPPCIQFSGDNGGATSRGVTKDKIVMTCRLPTGGGTYSFEQLIGVAAAQGVDISDSFEDQVRTAQTMVDYFNKNFQLYGRQVELRIIDGKGDPLAEILGGGQEGAAADALTVANEQKAFIDACALTEPYADALARQKVVAVGAIHMSTGWYQKRAPYAYGYFPDCTRLARSMVDYVTKRLARRPAWFAGDPAYRTQERKFGLFIPDQPEYQGCANMAGEMLAKQGLSWTKRIDYALDVNKLATFAANAVAQFKAAGVTTVACLCDPISPVFMTSAARQQDYWPEWVGGGVLLSDVDVLGSFYDQDQWSHAMTLSFLSQVYGGWDGEAYRVYKAMRQDEPTKLTHHLFYYGMLHTFIGLQMAGPNLTPETFRQGLFNFPKACGEAGCWSWAPDDLTAMDDARESYYSPTEISPLTCQPGRYVTTLGGQRFSEDWPTGDPEFPVGPPKDVGKFGSAISEDDPGAMSECGL